MAYNIGPKIGIDGEAEFRRQISQINTEYKTLVAQTKAVTAEFDKNGDEQGKLRATAAHLHPPQVSGICWKVRGGRQEPNLEIAASRPRGWKGLCMTPRPKCRSWKKS